ncbi:MAG: COX15/CtaA family protein [Bacillota bacterium]
MLTRGLEAAEPELRRFRRLALATGVATYLLVVLGGTVKAYGAGLACPDWPLCYGKVIPPFDFGVLLEWGHRVGGGVVSLMMLATAILGWPIKARAPWIGGGLLAAVALLMVQVVLGGVTVFMKNAAVATSTHLGVAMAFLAVLLYLGTAGPGRGEVFEPRLRTLSFATMLTAGALMVVGSYLKSTGGGMACPDWPLCQGRLIPPFYHWHVLLHWIHRVGALVLGVLILLTLAAAVRTQRSGIVGLCATASGLYAIQAGLGAWAVFSILSPPVVALHLAVAAALFGSLVLATVRTHSGSLDRGAGGFPLYGD